MERRELIYIVSTDGRVSPSVRRWAGVQHEDNMTDVVFDVSEIDDNDILWRIDLDSPESGYDPSGILENDGGLVRRSIPHNMTRFGGEIKATLVGTRLDGEGAVSSVAYSIPVRLFFTENETHEKDDVYINVSAAEKNANEAADRAEAAADAAAESVIAAEEIVNGADAVIQAAIDAANEAADNANEAAENIGTNKQDKFASVNNDGEGGDNTVQMDRTTHIVGKGESGLLIHNLAEPTNPQDAANKQYVDNAVKNAGGVAPEQLNAKQDKFAEVEEAGGNKYVQMDKPTHLIGNGESDLFIHNLADPSDTHDAANKKYVDNTVENAVGEQLDAKQDKFADVEFEGEYEGKIATTNINLPESMTTYINAHNYLEINADNYFGLNSKDAPVSVNNIYMWPHSDGSSGYINNLAMPDDADEYYAVNKKYVDSLFASLANAEEATF